MKNPLYLLCTWLFLAACGNQENAAPAEPPVDSVPALAAPPDAPEVVRSIDAFPELYEWMQRQDSSFHPERFPMYSEDTLNQATVSHLLDTVALAPWRAYLLYGPDSSQALDLYSSNYLLRKRGGRTTIEEGGPDTEVALIDFRKGLRRRLFFSGPAGTLLDARWLDDRTVLLAVAETGAANTYRPSLYKYDIAADRRWLTTYPALLRGSAAGYQQPQPLPKSF